jgi:hypothetical protein
MIKLLKYILGKRQPEPLPAEVAAINSALDKLRDATMANQADRS